MHILDAVIFMHILDAIIFVHILDAVIFMHIFDAVTFMHISYDLAVRGTYLLFKRLAHSAGPNFGCCALWLCSHAK